MTLNEFKAWLEGFSDAMGDTPTPEQWAKWQQMKQAQRDAAAKQREALKVKEAPVHQE